jgi:hypothetical protein
MRSICRRMPSRSASILLRRILCLQRRSCIWSAASFPVGTSLRYPAPQAAIGDSALHLIVSLCVKVVDDQPARVIRYSPGIRTIPPRASRYRRDSDSCASAVQALRGSIPQLTEEALSFHFQDLPLIRRSLSVGLCRRPRLQINRVLQNRRAGFFAALLPPCYQLRVVCPRTQREPGESCPLLWQPATR